MSWRTAAGRGGVICAPNISWQAIVAAQSPGTADGRHHQSLIIFLPFKLFAPTITSQVRPLTASGCWGFQSTPLILSFSHPPRYFPFSPSLRVTTPLSFVAGNWLHFMIQSSSSGAKTLSLDTCWFYILKENSMNVAAKLLDDCSFMSGITNRSNIWSFRQV